MHDDDLRRVAALLGQVDEQGGLSLESREALLALGNIGPELLRSLGSDGTGDELLLVTVLVDDTSSVGANAFAVRDGHNAMIAAVDGRYPVEVLFHTRYLSGGVLSPYRPIHEAVQLTTDNYAANYGVTPLYRQSVVTLGTVIAKTHEQEAQGREVRTFTLLITDGQNNTAKEVTAAAVKFLATDMREFASNHIIAGMGIGDEEYFKTVFTEMGIPAGWILTAPATPAEIQALFHVVEKSLQIAAGDRDSYRQIMAGPMSRSG